METKRTLQANIKKVEAALVKLQAVEQAAERQMEANERARLKNETHAMMMAFCAVVALGYGYATQFATTACTAYTARL